MSAERAYVERVSLKSRSRAGLRGVVPELEDALRTASWPSFGGHAGAVLLIRKLDLGRIRPGISRHQIGRLMSSRLNDMALVWVFPGDENDDADALLWPSEGALLASCVIAILGANVPKAQPWWVASGVKAAQASEPLLPALRRRLIQLFQDAGPIGIVDMLAHLIEADHSDLVISVAQEVPEIIESIAAPILEEVSKVAQLSWANIVDYNDPASVDRQQEKHALKAICIHLLSSKARKIWGVISEPMLREDVEIDKQIAVLALLLRGGTAPLSWPEMKRRILQELAAQRAVKFKNGTRVRKPKPKSRKRPLDVMTKNQKPHNNAAPKPADQPPRKAETEAPVLANPTFDALPTWAGGMPMLLNLIIKSGLPEIDANAETDLSLRVLHHFISRVHDSEAMLAALPELPDDVPLWATQKTLVWMPPVALLQPFARRLIGFKLPHAPDLYGLGLRGTNLIFGIGREDDFAVLTAVDLPIAIAPRPIDGDIASAFVAGVALILQRYLFELTGSGWRHAAQRRAYVAATQTHIDVTLDLDDVHLAERMSGLDMTPGWVAWLGRVVTLHFEAFLKPGRVQ